jgi:hypothetical protein
MGTTVQYLENTKEKKNKLPRKPQSLFGKQETGSIVKAVDGLLKEGSQILIPLFRVFTGPHEIFINTVQ